MSSLRVLVADDEPMGRQRLTRMLQDEPEVDVVASCGSGHAAPV